MTIHGVDNSSRLGARRVRRLAIGLLPFTLLACDFAEDAGGEFCTATTEIQSGTDLSFAFGFTPEGDAVTVEQVEDGVQGVREATDQFVSIAPEGLRKDAELLDEVLDDFLDAIEEAGFDVTALDLADPRVARLIGASAEDGSDSELDAATARIEAFIEEECGLNLGG